MGGWQTIVESLHHEFVAGFDLTRLTQLLLRLTTAALLGGLLGFERERARKSAGVRTHMLVAMGAALFVVAPEQAGLSGEDLSRVIQGLIAGIGFLGAGAILKQTQSGEIHGLTTAAGIWMTAAIGMTAGLGRLTTAAVATVWSLIVLAVLQHTASGGPGGRQPPDA